MFRKSHLILHVYNGTNTHFYATQGNFQKFQKPLSTEGTTMTHIETVRLTLSFPAGPDSRHCGRPFLPPALAQVHGTSLSPPRLSSITSLT